MYIEQPVPIQLLSSQVGTDQVISLNTTLTDSSLRISLLENSTYIIEIFAPFSLAGILSGYKFGFSGITSPASFIAAPKITTSASNILNSSPLSAITSTVSGALASAANHTFTATIVISTNDSGIFTFQFAQNVSDSSAITLKRGATMTARKLL